MNESIAVRRDAALQLHRAGRLDDAGAVYAALLEATPEDADLLGLLGVVELQLGRADAAEALLEHALAAGGAARVRLRNLNNMLALLQRAGRRDDARTLAAGEIPEWPGGVVPDDAERTSVLSLAEALLLLGEAGKAWALLSRAIPDRDGDGAALGLAGRLKAALGKDAAALGPLQRALEQAPGDLRLLIALAAVRERTGHPAEARRMAADFARRCSFHAEPAHSGQEATILIANMAPRIIRRPDAAARALHFAENFPSQIVLTMAQRYRFLSVFGDVPHPDSPWERENARLLVNNMVNSEWLNVGDRRDIARAFVDGTGLPVINHPEQVFQCTRQKNAALLAGIPGLVVPRIERYRPGWVGQDEITADIADKFDWPVIIRGVGSHQSSDTLLPGVEKAAYLASGPDEVRAALVESGWPEFYVIQFVDLKNPEGWYRKIRAIFMGDQIVVASGGYFDQWMTVGWRRYQPGVDFYRANPEALTRFRRLLDAPEAELGREPLEVLRRIRDRMPLDMFGMDFDVDARGRVVFFEATAAMNFYPPAQFADDFWMPMAPLEQMEAGFQRLVSQRIAAAA